MIFLWSTLRCWCWDSAKLMTSASRVPVELCQQVTEREREVSCCLLLLMTLPSQQFLTGVREQVVPKATVLLAFSYSWLSLITPPDKQHISWTNPPSERTGSRSHGGPIKSPWGPVRQWPILWDMRYTAEVLPGSITSALKTTQLIDSGLPWLSRIIFLT